MPRCRFFEDFHDYPQDECDRAYCHEVLGGAKPRLIPLHPEPDPATCLHDPEKLELRYRLEISAEERRCWREEEYSEFHMARMSMGSVIFKICKKCGAVFYRHPELGGPLVCYPVRRKA